LIINTTNIVESLLRTFRPSATGATVTRPIIFAFQTAPSWIYFTP